MDIHPRHSRVQEQGGGTQEDASGGIKGGAGKSPGGPKGKEDHRESAYRGMKEVEGEGSDLGRKVSQEEKDREPGGMGDAPRVDGRE
jgi:hypothetical protein